MGKLKLNKADLDSLTYDIVGAAIEVHKFLGPGLLESVYHQCMKSELTHQRLRFESELPVPIRYRDENMETIFRCDMLVEDSIVVEFKAVEALAPVHFAQVLTYMKLLEVPKGIIINFNCDNLFRSGQKTLVNELYRALR